MTCKIAVAFLTSVAVAVAGIATEASAANRGGGGGGFHGGGGGFHGGGGGGFHGGGGGGFHAGGDGFHGFASHGVSRSFTARSAAHGVVRHSFTARSAAHGVASHGNLGRATVHGAAAAAGGLAAHNALATHATVTGNHLTSLQFAHNQFAARNFEGFHNFNRAGFNRNAFGDPHHWNHWGHYFWGAGWNQWGWGWGGWAGPVFWPFLYGDLFSYLFWPYGYYDPFWAYGADFVLGSIFAPGPYFGADAGYGPDYYGYDGSPNVYYGSGPPPALTNADRADLAAVNAAATQSCAGMAPGVNDLPIAQLRQTLRPTPEQTALLDDLNAASAKANGTVAASCSNDLPLTPVDRLDAAKKRITAMIDAAQIVRPPFEKFYDSLSDEQKQQFDKMGSSEGAASSTDPQKLCGDQSGTTNVPVQRIDQVVQPNAQQQEAFGGLKTAAAKAAEQLQASCPTATPPNPVARLDAASARLTAIAAAMDTVRPALESFYASLSDEQKAKFNMMGPPPKTAAAQQSSAQ